jgi:rhodanese-related sulfurtransferase
MPDDLRITVDELRKRIQGGEEFTFIDTRNPQAWAESQEKLPGAIRIPADASAESLSNLPRSKAIVAYCT